MHVVGDAGPCRTTEVPAQIEAVRPVGAAERVDARDGKLVELERFVVGQISETSPCGGEGRP